MSFRLPALGPVLGAAIAAGCLLLPAGEAAALPAMTTYTTTLTPSDPGASIGRLEIRWRTGLDSGDVLHTDLDLLELKLFAPASDFVIVEDLAIAGGVVQPLGNVARAGDGVSFRFDLDAFALDSAAGLEDIRNDVHSIAPTATVNAVLEAGSAFDLLTARVFQDGALIGAWDGSVGVRTVVPLPAAGALMAGGLVVLGAAGRRRRGRSRTAA
ncbi:MAG: hypothetical protein CML46_14280 [Rhodobacteraceae bacterium]|nr:hypothetical protein [Paracoccaceae bacterium]MBR28094.1 hypothetical protein [Paracoccaceae bacterium]